MGETRRDCPGAAHVRREILGRERDVGRRQRLREPVAPPGADQRHDVIAAHKLAYKEQCLAFEASKETEDVSNSGSTN